MTIYPVGPLRVPRPLPARLAAPRRAVVVVALAAAAAAALACADSGGRDDAPPAAAPTASLGADAAREAPPPAGPGSGQPFLASDADGGVWMSWTEPASGGGHRVAAAYFDGAEGQWGTPVAIARGSDFFVNWADFPSIHPFGELLVAHWLQRGGGGGTYDYGVRLAWSQDEGATWSEPWTPHEDDTPTEHGFVSVFEAAGGANGLASPGAAGQGAAAGSRVWAAWLDGRAMVEPGGPMSLRARALPIRDGRAPAPPVDSGPAFAPDADPGPEELLDDRACECCQTDAVVVGGVPVVVFRDRGEGELRNIHVVRRLPSGWTESLPVHDDGWVVGGCPVNGPAMAERDGRLAVAWFTAPDGEARVNAAFSLDGGATFGPAFRLDAGLPVGRVDVAALDDGSALVTWLERGQDGGAVVAGRRVAPDGALGAARTLAASSEERASGFPRIARLGTDRLMLAWTSVAGDRSQVRVAVFDLDAWEAPS